jgi:hypothetical protein
MRENLKGWVQTQKIRLSAGVDKQSGTDSATSSARRDKQLGDHSETLWWQAGSF